jgi:hypothetical protein
MKYLKLFENNSFFTEIDDNEMIEIFCSPYYLGYSNNEFNIIKRVIANKFKLYAIIIHKSSKQELPNIGTTYRLGDKILKRRIDNEGVNIYRLEDEWYYVRHIKDGYKRKFYKCDQLDGLIKCLESI